VRKSVQLSHKISTEKKNLQLNNNQSISVCQTAIIAFLLIKNFIILQKGIMEQNNVVSKKKR